MSKSNNDIDADQLIEALNAWAKTAVAVRNWTTRPNEDGDAHLYTRIDVTEERLRLGRGNSVLLEPRQPTIRYRLSGATYLFRTLSPNLETEYSEGRKENVTIDKSVTRSSVKEGEAKFSAKVGTSGAEVEGGLGQGKELALGSDTGRKLNYEVLRKPATAFLAPGDRQLDITVQAPDEESLPRPGYSGPVIKLVLDRDSNFTDAALETSVTFKDSQGLRMKDPRGAFRDLETNHTKHTIANILMDLLVDEAVADQFETLDALQNKDSEE